MRISSSLFASSYRYAYFIARSKIRILQQRKLEVVFNKNGPTENSAGPFVAIYNLYIILQNHQISHFPAALHNRLSFVEQPYS